MNFEIPITAIVTLFTVIDPIGTIPVFIAVTQGKKLEEKKKVANKAALVSSAVLLFFIAVGEIVLNTIDIPLHSFQTAGGIILFVFAMTMIFGESKAEEELSHVNNKDDKAIFPLAIPSIASPGAILACVLLTENSIYNLVDQTITTIIMFSIVFLTWLCMLLSTKLYKYIGESGASLISRIMGLILASVAVNHVLGGIKLYFNL